jgi:hypothetical protein
MLLVAVGTDCGLGRWPPSQAPRGAHLSEESSARPKNPAGLFAGQLEEQLAVHSGDSAAQRTMFLLLEGLLVAHTRNNLLLRRLLFFPLIPRIPPTLLSLP